MPNLDTINSSDSSKINPHSPAQRGERVWHIRKMVLHHSRQQFSKKHGIPAPSLQNWETGKYGGLTEKGAQKLIQAFKVDGIECSIEWLLYGIGSPPMHYATGRPALLKADLQSSTELLQELQLFHKLHPNAVDAFITDNEMQPCFTKGDLVAGIRVFDATIANIIGQNCIIQLKDGTIWIRQLQKTLQVDHYALACINPESKTHPIAIESQTIFSVAPIIWWRKNPNN